MPGTNACATCRVLPSTCALLIRVVLIERNQMRNSLAISAVLGAALGLLAARPASATQFSSVNDCAVGKRVQLNNGQHGRITRIDRAWSYCYVLLDDTKKEVSFLYSLLSPEGNTGNSGDEAGNDKLIIGKYACFIGDPPQGAGELRVTGPSSYEFDGKRGSYHVEASGKIVFENGPFSSYHAKLLDNHRIGMNDTGGTFYNLTCDPPR